MDYDFTEIDPGWDDITPEQSVSSSIEDNEYNQLLDIAKHVGSFDYEYTDNIQAPAGNHIGPIAQDLLKVQGLDSLVQQDENGILTVNTQYAALAALSLVAALARKVLGVKYESTEVPQPVQPESGIQPDIQPDTRTTIEQTSK